MFRNPLGGYLSWNLQWILGFERLGHEVYVFERNTNHSNACYDPIRDLMSDDCSCGVQTVSTLLERFGLGSRWCFLDGAQRCHGLSRERVEEVFASADLQVDLGCWGAWAEEAAGARVRVMVDGEPGVTQMKLVLGRDWGKRLPHFHYHYTNGANIGTASSSAPDAGLSWRAIFNPVVVDLFRQEPPPPAAPFTTVMTWQAHPPLRFNGTVYGQKDVEVLRFIDLPGLTAARLEMAVLGRDVPAERLERCGWRVRDGREVSATLDAFGDYIRSSQGEFGVCKSAYVATNSGWFSDRSAAYLASGRPVVLQETGFSAHLPCGRGLFSARSPEEAAAAIDQINGDYERHSRWAREIAREYLDAPRVLGGFLREIGI